MGRVILCVGKTAKMPYIFRQTGTGVYTIEEMCYYLGQNIDYLSADVFDMEMASFICDELGLRERSELLSHLIAINADTKDRLAAVLCSCDFFREDEIQTMLTELHELEGMPQINRRKRRADCSMREGHFSDAMREYRSILTARESSELTAAEYGNILHNIAVLQVRAGVFDIAAHTFLEAYERNDDAESLKSYLFALKLSRQEELYQKELMTRIDSSELMNEMEEQIAAVDKSMEQSSEMQELERLRQLWGQERYSEYDRLVSEVIDGLKHKYREDNS